MGQQGSWQRPRACSPGRELEADTVHDQQGLPALGPAMGHMPAGLGGALPFPRAPRPGLSPPVEGTAQCSERASHIQRLLENSCSGTSVETPGRSRKDFQVTGGEVKPRQPFLPYRPPPAGTVVSLCLDGMPSVSLGAAGLTSQEAESGSIPYLLSAPRGPGR